MQIFPVHTIESAPEQSKPSLAALRAAFGMIPNAKRDQCAKHGNRVHPLAALSP